MKKTIDGAHRPDGTRAPVPCSSHDCPDCGEVVAWQRDAKPMKPELVARAHALHARTCTAKASP